MSKYKYYFKKPASQITKDIFTWLATVGIIYVAASSPYFVLNIWKNFQRRRQYPKRKFYDAFYRLRKRGYLEVERKGRQIYITLTEEGRRRAGRFQVNSLEIKKQKKWDRKWRLVIFDIAQLKKVYREAFRGKLKELKFYQLQKSVWIHPFPCRDEIELLKEFFGLSSKEVRLITSGDIGETDRLEKFFKLN